jgi:hypothetical protein
MDGDGPPRAAPSTGTTVGVLIAMAVVLLVAGLGIARVRNAQDTLRKAIASVTTTTPATAPSTPATPPQGSTLSPEQQKAVDDVKAQVSAIRGLAWKADLPIRVVSRAELARRVKELNAQDEAKHRDEIAADASVLKLLQLIPRDLDYTKAVDDLLAGGVLGFYDDEAKELFVGGEGTGVPDPATRSVLAHELTHALTDQQFDFASQSKALDDAHKSEESFAFTALIEGDAELVRTMWEAQHLSASERAQAAAGSSDSGGAYEKAPPYLLNSLQLPYVQGLDFVRARYRAGGFAAVDDAYKNPPTSTEQILHPEAYPAQGWTAPPLPDLGAATGCGTVDTGTLGEFDMGEVLAEQVKDAEAATAAAGWNGDAYGVVRCGTAIGLADRWKTDTPADAADLVTSLDKWARGWSGGNKAPDADGRFTGPKGSGRVVRSASGVVDLVLADDLATADRLVRALPAPAA